MQKNFEKYEYPLPKLYVDVDKIVIETEDLYSDSFSIKNIGGGELEGTITSNTKNVTFTPEKWQGNLKKIKFEFTLENAKFGVTDVTSVLIRSNGGEKIIPLLIKVVSKELITTDGEKLKTLLDFLEYEKKHHENAKQLFAKNDFLIWLTSIGFEHLKIYEHLVTDTNKDRALDNFFILCHLKEKTEISLLEKEVTLSVGGDSEKVISGSVEIEKNGSGYVELKLYTKYNSNWLKLKKNNITIKDFNTNNIAKIEYEVDTESLNQNFSYDSIVMEAFEYNVYVDINVQKKQPLKARLSKESFVNDDKGLVVIDNHTNTELLVELWTDDNYIKFEGKRYFVKGHAEIPFEIKLSPFQMAQMSFLKQPKINTKIYIKTIVGKNIVKKSFDVVVGNIVMK